MRTNSTPLKNIFEGTPQYKVPVYQRPYVWKQLENWVPLWEDIRSVAER